MKAILEFNLPQDQDEFALANRAREMSFALHEIHEKIFRPAFKHGYPDQALDELFQSLGEKGESLVELLNTIYLEILRENGVEDLLV